MSHRPPTLPPFVMSEPGATKETARIHRLRGKLAGIAKQLNLGRPSPSGTGWVFSLLEMQQARDEAARREEIRRKSQNLTSERSEPDRVPVPRDHWRREALRELKEIELSMLDLSRRAHRLGALIMASGRERWRPGGQGS